jgi:hypothetical protein
MTNHNLLAEINGTIKILIHRYGETIIKEEDILKYISATLHNYLPFADAEAIMKNYGTVHRKFRLDHDLEDPNGLFKIYKVTSTGYILSGSQELIARFWIDSNDKDISPKEFLGIEQPKV